MANAFQEPPIKSPVVRDKTFRKPLKGNENQDSLGDDGAAVPPGAAGHPIELTKKSTRTHAQLAWERLSPGIKNTEGAT